MTNQTLTEWIAERRAVHAAATKGPWEERERGDWRELVAVTKTRKTKSGRKVPVEKRPLIGWQEWLDGGYFWEEEDGAACIDAHNHLPALVAMVEAVLGAHQPVEIEPSDTICGGCSNLLPNGRYMPTSEWPCPTVRALEDAWKAVSGR